MFCLLFAVVLLTCFAVLAEDQGDPGPEDQRTEEPPCFTTVRTGNVQLSTSFKASCCFHNASAVVHGCSASLTVDTV